MAKEIYVRELMKEDLTAIIDMEGRATGVPRPEYWHERIDISEAIRPHWASLVAEVDNRVAGFILGRAGQLEFGLPASVAWIEYIRIDPVYAHHGVGRALIEQFCESALDHGVKTVCTLVAQDNAAMDGFLSQLGFEQGKMLHYQKEISV